MPETAVKDSILQSTKKLLGLEASYNAFDLDIITHINSAFSTLYQAGVGPLEGFMINDESDTWDRFIGNKLYINDVKTYIYYRVKLDFDPPGNSFGLDAGQKRVDELLWRLNVADDHSFGVLPPVEDVDKEVIRETVREYLEENPVSADEPLLREHLEDETPHPVYDELPDGHFSTMLRNGMA